jgi:hypothetical protein
VARAISPTTADCPDAAEDFLRARRAGFAERRAVVRHPQAVVGGSNRILRHFLQRFDDAGDVRCGFCRPIGEIANLLRDHRKTAAGVAGAGGLDRGVQRQQIRPLGDQADRVDDAVDLVGRLLLLKQHRVLMHHTLTQLAETLHRSLHRRAALFGIARDAPGQLVALLAPAWPPPGWALHLQRAGGRAGGGVGNPPPAGGRLHRPRHLFDRRRV